MKINNPFQLDKLHASAIYALAVGAVFWFALHHFSMAFSWAGSTFSLDLMLGSWGIVLWFTMLLPYGVWLNDRQGLTFLKSILIIGIGTWGLLALLSTARWMYGWYTTHEQSIYAVLSYQVEGVGVLAAVGWTLLIVAGAGAVYWDLFRKRERKPSPGNNPNYDPEKLVNA